MSIGMHMHVLNVFLTRQTSSEPNTMTTLNFYTVLFVCASKNMFMVSTIKVVSITLGHISSILPKTTHKHFSLGTIKIL